MQAGKCTELLRESFIILNGMVMSHGGVQIEVKSPNDVRAAYAYSHKTNIPLVIKNSGVGPIALQTPHSSSCIELVARFHRTELRPGHAGSVGMSKDNSSLYYAVLTEYTSICRRKA